MAKQSGVGVTTLAVDDGGGTARDIKNAVTSVEIAISRETDNVTGLDSGAMERLLLLGDASVTLNGKVDFAANAVHDTLSSAATSDDARTVTFTLASNTFAAEMLLTGYQLNRPNSGALDFTSGLVLADGTEPAWS